MLPLRLFFLGPPRIELGGQLAEVDTRKATALLAYLALTGERQSRDFLAAFLWPDFDDSHAKAALRRTLSALKTAVGANMISATRDVIGLNLDTVWCDVSVFQQCLEQGDLETAVSLYRHDFLTGFTLRDSLPFDDWQRMQQEALRRDLAQALAHLAQHTSGETAVAHARRWCQLEPLHEDAHRQLMQALAANGRHTEALQQYRDCVRILDEELGVPPLPETTALYHLIQNDRLTPIVDVSTALSSTQPAAASSPIASSPISSSSLPLVGRGTELARMQQVYGAMGSNGRLLAIFGEVGIGKTRLTEEFVTWAQGQGALVLSARCYEGENNLAYAPIIQAMRTALSQPGAAERLATVPPYWLAEAARLLPELAAHLAAPLAAPESPGAQNRFFDGVGQTLAALLHGPVPGVFWLDDAHWLDSASLELLLYLLRRWRERPSLILLCWRTEEMPGNHPLAQMTATLHRADAAERIQLTRLTLEQIAELVTAAALPADLPDRLYQETEGLPYFVVEYLYALTAQDTDQPWHVPGAVRELLLGRLAQVAETERQLLQTAAAIGHAFMYELVQKASGRSEEETVIALENLVARGILVEQTVTATGSVQAVYDFSHEKLRALAYEQMGLARRRLLHRRLAETLTDLVRRQSLGVLLPAQIATHYRLAGKDEEAAVYFVQAGDQARALFAHQDAIHYYRSALALGAEDAWRLHAACGELSMRLGAYPDALDSYETAAALAPTFALSSLEQQLAQVYQRQGEWLLAAHTLTQAQYHLDETADPAAVARLLIDRSLVAHRQKQPQAALAWAQQAQTLAEAATDIATLAQADNILGLLARNRGELGTAVALLEQSRQLAADSGRLDIQIAAGNNLALTLYAAGQLTAAQTNLEQALILCQRIGDRHHEAALRSNLADVLHQAGDEAAAQAQIRQSATIYADIGRDQEMWRAEIWQLMEW